MKKEYLRKLYSEIIRSNKDFIQTKPVFSGDLSEEEIFFIDVEEKTYLKNDVLNALKKIDSFCPSYKVLHTVNLFKKDGRKYNRVTRIYLSLPKNSYCSVYIKMCGI